MTRIYNPLYTTASGEKPEELESTSRLINDVIGICPKCKQPFGTGTVPGDTVYYCERCRVTQPIPQ